MSKPKGLPFPDNFMAIFGFYRVPGSERMEEVEYVPEEEYTDEEDKPNV